MDKTVKSRGVDEAQTWNAHRYSTHARFMSDMGESVLASRDARSAERILDLGCGDGVLTRRMVDALGADVVGVDSAPDLVRAARELGLNMHLMVGAVPRREPGRVLDEVTRLLKPVLCDFHDRRDSRLRAIAIRGSAVAGLSHLVSQ